MHPSVLRFGPCEADGHDYRKGRWLGLDNVLVRVCRVQQNRFEGEQEHCLRRVSAAVRDCWPKAICDVRMIHQRIFNQLSLA